MKKIFYDYVRGKIRESTKNENVRKNNGLQTHKSRVFVGIRKIIQSKYYKENRVG